MRNNEIGRSMVEMLGVLAIIGVLSVAGVAGYTMAMNKYKANEIVELASLLVVRAQSADAGAGDCVQLSTANLSQKPEGVEIVADATIPGTTRVTIQASPTLCAIIDSIQKDYSCQSTTIEDGC